MRDLRVELHAVERPRAVSGGGVGAGGRGGQGDELGRQVVDLVAVTHPHRHLARQAVDERLVGLDDRQLGPPELPRPGRLHLTAQELRTELHAVADAQDRNAQVEDARVALGRVRLVNATRAAAENDPLGLELAEFFDRRVRAHQLGEDALLPHPAGDELNVLRPEIEDRDDFVVAGVSHREYLP
jgi:hypothetical protein